MRKTLAVLFSCSTAVGCSQIDQRDNGMMIGAADPSSVYCVEQGGQIDVVNTSEGERAFCTLPDGERIDAWDLFRESQNRNSGEQASQRNPASAFCIQSGGTLHSGQSPTGQVNYCTLPNGSTVEEWEFFRASEQEPSAGAVSPASKFCVDSGGRVQIAPSEDGEVGICILPDGQRVEEWDFYESNSNANNG